MILRPATIDDLELVQYWDTKQHVIDSDPDDEWDWDKELRRDPIWRDQLIAEVSGEAIGFIQVIDPLLEETHYWGEIGANKRAIDIWIGEEANLNKGYGTTMMNMIIQQCFSNESINSILVDPLFTNRKAHRFYKRLGFAFVEKRVFNEVLCLVYELTRANWRESCEK
ncbi:MAG: GNAT family N-acetyltransferase [Bacteroidota bacterium]